MWLRCEIKKKIPGSDYLADKYPALVRYGRRVVMNLSDKEVKQFVRPELPFNDNMWVQAWVQVRNGGTIIRPSGTSLLVELPIRPMGAWSNLVKAKAGDLSLTCPVMMDWTMLSRSES